MNIEDKVDALKNLKEFFKEIRPHINGHKTAMNKFWDAIDSLEKTQQSISAGVWVKVNTIEDFPVFSSHKKQYVVRYILIPDEYLIWSYSNIEENFDAEYVFEWLDESVKQPYFNEEKKYSLEDIEKSLDALTNDERYDIFSKYCRSCGLKDTSCQCWNDE
jgi:hypothetical protein